MVYSVGFAQVALARHSKSKLFLYTRLLATFSVFCFYSSPLRTALSSLSFVLNTYNIISACKSQAVCALWVSRAPKRMSRPAI